MMWTSEVYGICFHDKLTAIYKWSRYISFKEIKKFIKFTLVYLKLKFNVISF